MNLRNYKYIGIAGNGTSSGKTTTGLMLYYLLGNYNIKSNYKTFNTFKWSYHDFLYYFANPVKEIVILLTGNIYTLEELDKSKNVYLPKFKMTVRQLMIHVGMTYRELNSTVWIDALFSSFETNEKIIIADVRFDNEIQAIKEKGGIVIRVNKGEKLDTNLSEKGITIPVSLEIDNNGTEEDLFNLLKTYIKDIK